MEKSYGIVRFQIRPGQSAAFLDCARACMAAARTDLDGTHAYEWFMQEDSEQCLVIEIYDGAAGMANHGRQVGKHIAQLLEHADSDVTLLGRVPDGVAERLAARFPGLGVFGPRFQGLLNEAAPGAVAHDAGGKIFAVAHFEIVPGKLEAFQERARACFAIVARDEPGTLGYEWFISPDGRRCVTLDIYRDAAALAAHMGNAGAVMAQILELVESRVELYGAVPAALLARLQGDLGVRYGAPQCQGIL